MEYTNATCVLLSDLSESCVPGYVEPGVSIGSIFLILILLCCSALFSGLNLGLMSLDSVELEIVAASGTPAEKRYASALMPIRKHGNFLLCVILLGNTCVNSLVAIFLASLTSGLAGSLISTFALVVFGEIIPQSFCSRHGLAVGYHTRFLVVFFMVVLSPVAFPIAICLDKILGQEVGTVYNRAELRSLVELHGKSKHGDLLVDEVKMLDGALRFAGRRVEEIMTNIRDCFMLHVDSRLDYATMSAIVTSGHSRVPIYDDNQEVLWILLIKNLILLNPDEATPIRSLLPLGIARVPLFVEPNLTLDKMLNEFQKGATHMALVRRRTPAGDQNIGIVTLEDVIEALIQEEIADEGDAPDGLQKRTEADVFVKMYGRRHRFVSSTMTPHELEAVTHYLAGSYSKYFGQQVMADESIRELLKKSTPITVSPSTVKDKPKYLMERGKRADSCFLVLGGGPLEILATSQQFRSEAGPWVLLGLEAILNADGFVPDFSAKVTTITRVLRIDNRSYNLSLFTSKFKKIGPSSSMSNISSLLPLTEPTPATNAAGTNAPPPQSFLTRNNTAESAPPPSIGTSMLSVDMKKAPTPHASPPLSGRTLYAGTGAAAHPTNPTAASTALANALIGTGVFGQSLPPPASGFTSATLPAPLSLSVASPTSDGWSDEKERAAAGFTPRFGTHALDKPGGATPRHTGHTASFDLQDFRGFRDWTKPNHPPVPIGSSPLLSGKGVVVVAPSPHVPNSAAVAVAPVMSAVAANYTAAAMAGTVPTPLTLVSAASDRTTRPAVTAAAAPTPLTAHSTTVKPRSDSTSITISPPTPTAATLARSAASSGPSSPAITSSVALTKIASSTQSQRTTAAADPFRDAQPLTLPEPAIVVTPVAAASGASSATASHRTSRTNSSETKDRGSSGGGSGGGSGGASISTPAAARMLTGSSGATTAIVGNDPSSVVVTFTGPAAGSTSEFRSAHGVAAAAAAFPELELPEPPPASFNPYKEEDSLPFIPHERSSAVTIVTNESSAAATAETGSVSGTAASSDTPTAAEATSSGGGDGHTPESSVLAADTKRSDD